MKIGELYLIRHGMREDFIDPSWRERSNRPHDTPLCTAGFLQARETAKALKGRSIGVIYSSPFLRTVQTACEIARILEVPVKIEYGLMEQLRAEWFSEMPHFLSPESLKETYPLIDTTYRYKVTPTFPEDENEPDTVIRCGLTVDAILEDAEGPPLLVAHGASVACTAQALIPGVKDVCCNMCGINTFSLTDYGWEFAGGSVSHLSQSEESLRLQ